MRALARELCRAGSAQEVEHMIMQAPVGLLDSVNCSTAIAQLGKWHSRNPQAIDKVVRASQQIDFSPRELSTYCHGLARGRLVPALPAFLLDKIPHTKLSTMDVAMTMWSAARLNHSSAAGVLVRSSNMWEADWQRAKPQDIANTAWALASLPEQHPAGVRFAEQVVLSSSRGPSLLFNDFNAFDLSNTAWSLAKLGVPKQGDDESLVVVAQSVVLRALQLQWTVPQDVANLLWALATWRSSASSSSLLRLDDLLERIFNDHEAGSGTLHAFKPKELATTAWALVSLNSATFDTTNSVLRRIAHEVQGREDIRKTQDLASLLWSLASSSPSSASFSNVVATICSRLKHTLRQDSTPHELATIAWSLATLRHYDPALMDLIADLHHARLSSSSSDNNYTPQDISNTVWAFAKLEHYSPKLMTAVGDEVGRRQRRDFSSHALINLLWSFAHLRVSNAKLCQQVCNALLLPERQPELASSFQDLCSAVFAMAILDCRNRELFSRIAVLAKQHIERDDDKLAGDKVLMLAWSFACCNVLRLDAVRVLFQLDAGGSIAAVERTARSATQLHQCRLAWNHAHAGEASALLDALEHGPGGGDGNDEDDDDWVARGRVEALRDVHSSKTHVSITRQLREHFPGDDSNQEEEVVMETLVNGISVDILLPALRTVVEIDGPHHFFANERETRTGTTLFKLRLLKSAGFQVLSVPVLHVIGHHEHVKTVQNLIATLLRQQHRQRQQQNQSTTPSE